MQNWVKTILRDVLLSREVVMGKGIVEILHVPLSEFENNNGVVRLRG